MVQFSTTLFSPPRYNGELVLLDVMSALIIQFLIVIFSPIAFKAIVGVLPEELTLIVQFSIVEFALTVSTLVLELLRWA